MGLDLVAQEEIGAGAGATGLVELFAAGGQRLGAPGAASAASSWPQAGGRGAWASWTCWLVRRGAWRGGGLRSASRRVPRLAAAARAGGSARRTRAAAAFLAGLGTSRSGSSGTA